MKLPPPCDEDLGMLAARSLPDEAESPIHHYERAIGALVSTTNSGLSSSERRKLLATLCREKQRLHEQQEGQDGRERQGPDDVREENILGGE